MCTLSLSLAVVLSIENHYFISAVAKEEEEEEEEEEENLAKSKTAKPHLSAERLVQPDELSCLKPFPTGPLRRAGRGREDHFGSLRSCSGRTKHDVACTQVFPAGKFNVITDEAVS
jgi:hypothetical protein